MAEGIKTKERVKQYGEVFTPDSIVSDMLDLVDKSMKESHKDFTAVESLNEYINRTYLEPACGDGQFLIRILSRKMEVVKKLPECLREINLIKALCSIYGVDIQADNVIESRMRMKAVAFGESVTTFDVKGKSNIVKVDLGIKYTDKLKKCIEHILDTNIMVGNTLKTDSVYVTSWVFTGTTVECKEWCLAHLEDECFIRNKYKPIHYLDLPLREIVDDGFDEYDF